MSKKIDQATEALDVATKAHDEAQNAYRAARAAYDAQRTDEQWSAVEETQRAVARRAADRTAAEKDVAAAKAAEAAEAGEQARAAKLARLEEIRAIETKRTPGRHVSAITKAERGLAVALAAARADEAESLALHREATEIAAALGNAAGLPPVRTFAQVRALISMESRTETPFVVADVGAAIRTPQHQVLLPRAPTAARACAAFIADLLGETPFLTTDEAEDLFPAAERVSALLAGDGSYAARYKAAATEIKSREAKLVAEATARRLERDREVGEREARQYPNRFRQI